MSGAPELPSPVAPDPEQEAAQWRARARGLEHLVQRSRGNYQLFVGGSILLGFLAVAIASVAFHGGLDQNLSINSAIGERLHPIGPSPQYPFGTINGIGVNLLPALVEATPIDLILIAATILGALSVGLLAGAYAGLVHGTVDLVVTGVSDLLVGVPPFFLVMVMFLGVQQLMRQNDYLIVFVVLFAAILWPYYARPVRAGAQQVAGEPFVESARAAGAGDSRILRRHILPNSLSPVLAQVPVDLYSFFFVFTTFPFLGCFGNQSGSGVFLDLTPLPTFPYPEWGFLLGEGVCYGWSPLPSLDFWWMYTFPAAVIILFGIGVTLTCDGIGRYLR